MKSMKEYETLKVYGDTLNYWKAYDEQLGREVVTQREVEYKEYDSQGNLINVGTEDFSTQRWNESSINHYEAWGWDGEHLQKGGKRYFDRLGTCRIRKQDLYKLKHLLPFWNRKQYQVIDVRAF